MSTALGLSYDHNGDSRIKSSGSQATANYYSTPAAQAQLLAYDQKVAKDLNIPLNQVSPQVISSYEQQAAAHGGGFMDQVFMNKIVPMLAVSGLTAGIGSAAGAALSGTAATAGTAATSGALGASIGTGGALMPLGSALVGAGTGALGGGLSATMNGGNIGKGILTGALTGGVTGGLASYASPVTNSLANTVGNTAANGIVRGAIGAGVGALGSAVTGGSPSNGALVGGVSGAASGVMGSLSGNKSLGNVAGTIGGGLASKYLTSPTTPAAPAASLGLPPTSAQQQGIIPQLPAAPASGPTNIGSYSGYGYAPQQLNQNPVSDYSTYGQGPEASFFQPQGTQPSQPPMMSATQGNITRANST